MIKRMVQSIHFINEKKNLSIYMEFIHRLLLGGKGNV